MTSRDLNTELASLANAARVASIRAWSWLGWPGLMGILLTILALVLGRQAWALRSSLTPLARPTVSVEVRDLPSPLLPPQTPPALPQRADVAALLAQIEQHVKAQGLAWPQADYRLAPLTAERLSELEVSFTLQGPYPKLRGLLNELLDAQPALALRDLSLRRSHSDAADVEAKLVLVVYLRDGWPHAQPGSVPPGPLAASGVAP